MNVPLSIEEWKQELAWKSAEQMAKILLTSLEGYRKNSSHRTNDQDNLRFALTTIKIMAARTATNLSSR